MKILGITGSIGMGKSLVAALLRQKNVPVFDSDLVVNKLLSKNGRAVPLVAREFPEVFDRNSNRIDKQKLGGIVFNNAKKREKLEQILHPMVDASQKDFIRKARRLGINKVAIDVPLLFETGGNKKCSAVLCVTTPFFIQKMRVMRRKGMTIDKFKHILSTQLPSWVKCRMADYVLPTSLSRAETLQKFNKIWRKFIKEDK